MPFWVTKRSLRLANLVGNQRSSAMYERMRGASMKPVCAAMMRMAISLKSVTITNVRPTPGGQLPETASRRTALSVLPSWCFTPKSR
jgi:hypothetical protein